MTPEVNAAVWALRPDYGGRRPASPWQPHIWFVFERLEPMPIEALLQAGESIAEGVRSLAPHAQISQRLICKSD